MHPTRAIHHGACALLRRLLQDATMRMPDGGRYTSWTWTPLNVKQAPTPWWASFDGATDDPTTLSVANAAHCIVVHGRPTCRCVRLRTSRVADALPRLSALPSGGTHCTSVTGRACRLPSSASTCKATVVLRRRSWAGTTSCRPAPQLWRRADRCCRSRAATSVDIGMNIEARDGAYPPGATGPSSGTMISWPLLIHIEVFLIRQWPALWWVNDWHRFVHHTCPSELMRHDVPTRTRHGTVARRTCPIRPPFNAAIGRSGRSPERPSPPRALR